MAGASSAIDYDMLTALDRHFSWSNTVTKKTAKKSPAAAKKAKAGKAEAEPEAEQEASAGGALENYTVHLNGLAIAGKIDPLIGRQTELERTIVQLTDDAIAAIEHAPLTAEARDELVALAAYVSHRLV